MSIVEEKRLTVWFVYKCDRKGCRRKIEAVRRRFVELNASRHVTRHERLDRENITYTTEVLGKIEA